MIFPIRSVRWLVPALLSAFCAACGAAGPSESLESMDGPTGVSESQLYTYKWAQTAAQGMVDAERGVAADNTPITWVVGFNATLWYSYTDSSWINCTNAPATARVAGGTWVTRWSCGSGPFCMDVNDRYFGVWSVGLGGALYRTFDGASFEQMPITGVVDVGVSTGLNFGYVWVVKSDGTLHYSTDGQSWTMTGASGLARVSADATNVFAVGVDGSLWSRPIGADSWSRHDLTSSGGTLPETLNVVDVAAAGYGRAFVTLRNGAVEHLTGGSSFNGTGGGGFGSIGRDADGAITVGKTNQTVWTVATKASGPS